MSADETDYGLVACVRMRDIDRPYPGSRIFYCVDCELEVWASPASQQIIAEGLPVMCIPCVTRLARTIEQDVTPVVGTDEKLAHFHSRNVKPWPFRRGQTDA